MPRWTKEQAEAIEKEHTNIIVSAGAGSGKTAVLTARVLRKLKQGVHIDELLILTFTNEAAQEMKNRIRASIQKEESLKQELERIDVAYVTTFDSYALSIVKKYYDRLNVSPNISIIDSSIIKIKKQEILDQIFEEEYQKKNLDFTTIIDNFCSKDDKELKNAILSISNKLELKMDKKKEITTYLSHEDEKNILFQQEYQNLLKQKLKLLEEAYQDFASYEDSKYKEKVFESLKPLLISSNYEEIKKNVDQKLPPLPKNSSQEVKDAKKKIEDIKKEIKTLTSYEDEQEIKESLEQTKRMSKVILDIIEKLDEEIIKYKKEKDVYEFMDISKMAIQVVKENKDIKEELKSYYNEIMVDEYQDTNDLQEAFIKEIENNNVYMVGDIKQSIYRFRNANPKIFKEKYENYQNHLNGEKIDLLKNFRSRKEVLDDINKIFNYTMDLKIGGAEYQQTHQMIFGNLAYEGDNKPNQNYQTEIYTYKDELKEFTDEEKEIFIIAQDIKTKIKNHYQIFDKDTGLLHDMTYSDCCIILDRGTSFQKYKQIFEYEKIPLTIYQDEKLTNEIEIKMIKNILSLIIKIKTEEPIDKMKYEIVSIARSFLFEKKDPEIFDWFYEDKLRNNEIYQKAYEISKSLDEKTPLEIIELIIKEYDFYKKLITIGDLEKSFVRIEYIENLIKNLEQLEYSIDDVCNYLKETIEGDNEIKYSASSKASNSVKIMNIHKSKGLEFSICYFAGLSKPFNTRDLKERFSYDETYGLILPYFKDGIKDTIKKHLRKEQYNKEEISEKIRLFYVAMTRCKEKMIFVMKESEHNNPPVSSIIEDTKRLSYKSFYDILDALSENLNNMKLMIDLNKVPLTREYQEIKAQNYSDFIEKTFEKQEIREVNISKEKIKESNKFSKQQERLITKEESKNMEYGTHIHEIFERVDFKNPTNIPLMESEQKYINNFLMQPIFKNLDECQIYKEYEFIEETNDDDFHGIIDLMIETNDKIIIVDYKLKEITDEAYLKQIKGYQNIIENKTGKEVECYLYSILKNNLVQISTQKV